MSVHLCPSSYRNSECRSLPLVLQGTVAEGIAVGILVALEAEGLEGLWWW